jgi:fatty acid synthase subunit alpha
LRSGKPEDVTDYDPAVTNMYYHNLAKMGLEGVTFHHKVVLVTGAGKGSIGIELLKGLLAGGATIVVTTSRFSSHVTEMYKTLYEEWGSKDSQLMVLPFNQGYR